MIRRHFHGWHKDGAFFLSSLPADAPVRPCARYETVHEIKALLRRRGVTIAWWPPLPEDIRAEIEKGPRLDGAERGGSEVLRLGLAEG